MKAYYKRIAKERKTTLSYLISHEIVGRKGFTDWPVESEEVMSTTKQAIDTAKKFMDEGRPEIAAHVLRDLPIIDSLGLHDLAWAMCRDDSYVTNADVNFLIEQLEA